MGMKHLRLKAYGKINLGLDVVKKREDGYHEVRMIMQTVGIYDTIDLYREEAAVIKKQLAERKGQNYPIIVDTNLYYLPNNENNLVYKAAKLLMEEFGICGGLRINLRKFIPVAAGMAGGSSDAAAVLYGVNKIFGLGLKTKELMERGVKIGADVPYCIMRGTALSEGIGEILTPLPSMPQCQILIVKPGISVSTKFVYENLKANELKPEEHPDIDGMIEAIKRKDLHGVTARFGNVLERVTIPAYPVIQDIKDMMKELGAVNAMMSGSGPTVFGIFENPSLAAAACEEFRYGKGAAIAKQVYLTSFFNNKETF